MADTPDITATLAQRGNAYGDFREQGRITQNLKRAMQDSPNWARLPSYMREGLDMVQHKVSRMLNGDAYYDDNMHDIVGYTKLMQDRAKQDRDNGAMWEHGGDRMYPAYDHEELSQIAQRQGTNAARRAAGLPPIEEAIKVSTTGKANLDDMGTRMDEWTPEAALERVKAALERADRIKMEAVGVNSRDLRAVLNAADTWMNTGRVDDSNAVEVAQIGAKAIADSIVDPDDRVNAQARVRDPSYFRHPIRDYWINKGQTK